MPVTAPARFALIALALTALVGGSVACGGAKQLSPQQATNTARVRYYDGMQELVSGNYLRASQLFRQVARSPRYMRYAALARLRIGDALFLQDRYEEAIEVYRSFIAQYESDPNIPYARFRIAASYYQRLPSEWFASPPDHEIDQTVTTEAVRELSAFINTFPTSRFAARARKMLGEARHMLYRHEAYVADFYEAKDEWRAVAWRLDRAIQSYPEFATTSDNVFRMAQAYERAGDRADAARGYARYLQEFPKGELRGEAKARLDKIRAAVEAEAKDS